MPLATPANQGPNACASKRFYDANTAYCRTTQYARPTAKESFQKHMGGMSDDVFDVLSGLAAGPAQGPAAGFKIAAKVKKVYDVFEEPRVKRPTKADNLYDLTADTGHRPGLGRTATPMATPRKAPPTETPQTPHVGPRGGKGPPEAVGPRGGKGPPEAVGPRGGKARQYTVGPRGGKIPLPPKPRVRRIRSTEAHHDSLSS